jgi:xylulokinase
MPITALRPGWAEQDPAMWWANLTIATRAVLATSGAKGEDIAAIGISYQMHGLVLIDKERKLLRPSIIWCDSRAVSYGQRAFEEIGADNAMPRLLNSPGNFTAAKLAWVKENEPELYNRTDKFMLPGDYIAMCLTGEVTTTVEGLSEGVFWDFSKNEISSEVMNAFGFSDSLVPTLAPVFGVQGRVNAAAASELGLKAGTPVTYRAGDQPNNALSLGVMEPGQIAATAGTSGVVYGVAGSVVYDPRSRVNVFAHVNHTAENPRLGVLLCINGTGILNSWIRRNISPEGIGYGEQNELAALSPVGSRGVSVVPFGNGAERILENRDPGCSIHGVNFNINDRNDLLRASQEGIAFSFAYGMEIMRGMGMEIDVIRAGNANMMLSPLLREALATTGNASIKLYDTDGAAGAARGAGIGAGVYSSPDEAFGALKCLSVTEPDASLAEEYRRAYEKWKACLPAAN